MDENTDKLLCKKCGTANEADHRFCAACGANLAAQAREAKGLKTSRLGCLGCLGIFLAIFAAFLIGVFFYLKKDGVIYTDRNDRLTITYVTIFAPMLSKGDDDPMPYRPDKPPTFTPDDNGEIKIRLHFRYLAYARSAKPLFIVRTSRKIPPTVEDEFPKPERIYISTSHPKVEKGYDQGLIVPVFAEGAKPKPGMYITEILVDREGKGDTEGDWVSKRQVRFEILASK